MKHFTRQTIAFAAGAVAGVGLGLGGAAIANGGDNSNDDAASSAVAGVTVIAECLADETVSQPETFTVACGDGNAKLVGLTWSDWGKATATATGELAVTEGDKTENVKVTVSAEDLVEGEAAARYGQIKLHFDGDAPAGFDQDEVIKMPVVE